MNWMKWCDFFYLTGKGLLNLLVFETNLAISHQRAECLGISDRLGGQLLVSRRHMVLKSYRSLSYVGQSNRK